MSYRNVKAAILSRLDEIETDALKYRAGQPRDKQGQFAGAGSGGGAAAEQITAGPDASTINSRNRIVSQTTGSALDKEAAEFRKEGSQTYSSQQTSPNMGTRYFIDISNKDPQIQATQAAKAQQKLDTISTEVRHAYTGAMTYSSQMNSPNMGTRVFMDVDLSRSSFTRLLP